MYIGLIVATRFGGMGHFHAKNCLKTHKIVVHICVLLTELSGITRTDIWTTTKKQDAKTRSRTTGYVHPTTLGRFENQSVL
jgi:hypothetical protein